MTIPVSSVGLTSEKDALRIEMKRRLGQLDGAQAAAAGAAIDRHLRESELWHDATGVVGFASIPDEIDTGPLLSSVLDAGKRLLLPRMVEDRGLEFAEAETLATLVPRRFGVREPGPECAAARLEAGMVILVPGLAFDRHGGRLGRGAGYYDRALAAVRETGRPPLSIGVGFGLQLVENVPMTSHDERLDGILTEHGLHLVREGPLPQNDG